MPSLSYFSIYTHTYDIVGLARGGGGDERRAEGRGVMGWLSKEEKIVYEIRINYVTNLGFWINHTTQHG